MSNAELDAIHKEALAEREARQRDVNSWAMTALKALGKRSKILDPTEVIKKISRDHEAAVAACLAEHEKVLVAKGHLDRAKHIRKFGWS